MTTEATNSRAVCMQAIDGDAVKAGFPITCASCKHFKNAQQTDAENCGRMLTCGGPIYGRSFPDYDGPISPEVFEKVCLICGSEHVEFHILANLRRFGLCFKHRSIFDRVSGPGTQVPAVVRIEGRLI
jgi:hypothetical protein